MSCSILMSLSTILIPAILTRLNQQFQHSKSPSTLKTKPWSASRMLWLGPSQKQRKKRKEIKKKQTKILLNNPIQNNKVSSLLLMKANKRKLTSGLLRKISTWGGLIPHMKKSSQLKHYVLQLGHQSQISELMSSVRVSFMAQVKNCSNHTLCRPDFKSLKPCRFTVRVRTEFPWFTCMTWSLTLRKQSKRNQKFLTFWHWIKIPSQLKRKWSIQFPKKLELAE